MNASFFPSGESFGEPSLERPDGPSEPREIDARLAARFQRVTRPSSVKANVLPSFESSGSRDPPRETSGGALMFHNFEVPSALEVTNSLPSGEKPMDKIPSP